MARLFGVRLFSATVFAVGRDFFHFYMKTDGAGLVAFSKNGRIIATDLSRLLGAV